MLEGEQRARGILVFKVICLTLNSEVLTVLYGFDAASSILLTATTDQAPTPTPVSIQIYFERTSILLRSEP